MATKLLGQDAVMGQVISKQDPAVVLRSHYNAVRGLLAAALVAVAGLAGATAIVAGDDTRPATRSAQPRVQRHQVLAPDPHHGGGRAGRLHPGARP
jgi:hypothetical protein